MRGEPLTHPSPSNDADRVLASTGLRRGLRTLCDRLRTVSKGHAQPRVGNRFGAHTKTIPGRLAGVKTASSSRVDASSRGGAFGTECWVDNFSDALHLFVEVRLTHRFKAFLAAPRGPLRLTDCAVASNAGSDRSQIDLAIAGDGPRRQNM